MTNKRKKRIREHAAATGMSYQASANALSKPRGGDVTCEDYGTCACGEQYANFRELQPDGKRGGPALCHRCVALPLGQNHEPACECGTPLHRMGERVHMASSLAYASSVDGRPLCVDCWGNGG